MIKSRTRERVRLKRICDKCEKKYLPGGRFQRYCNNCRERAYRLRNLKK